jgi:hypothetical protein
MTLFAPWRVCYPLLRGSQKPPQPQPVPWQPVDRTIHRLALLIMAEQFCSLRTAEKEAEILL